MTDPTIVVGVAGIGLVAGATLVQMTAPVAVTTEISTTLIIGAAVGGIVTIITAATAAIVTVLTALRTGEEARQAKIARDKAAKDMELAATVRATSVAKLDELGKVTGEIHTTANGTLSKANEALTLMRMEFRGLQESTAATIEGLRNEIRVLNEARTAAVAATTPATVPPPHAIAPTESDLASVKVIVEDTNKVVNDELKKP